ncbi:MAG: hydroxymethylbilane synthase [Proteobacteria bacterium]|nr:hydroxymethylbilane synthase [Pseudomonadota bacterium]
MNDERPIVIGTRGSPLALRQTELARDALVNSEPALAEPGRVRIEIIKTTGDQVQDRALAELGGKGLFTKELDQAMAEGRIDIAVHSMKDLETWLQPGIRLACMLPREDPRDVLISRLGGGIGDLPNGALIGTASIRRQAQLLSMRPDLKFGILRGNVQTRLGKLKDGVCDATFLALAGLKRLGMADVASDIIAPDILLPACGQGAVGITCRDDDAVTLTRLAAINDAPTWAAVTCERAMLAVLDGSCRTPIGGLAEIEAGTMRLRGLVARADGTEIFRTERQGSAADAERIGKDAGFDLRGQAPANLFGA